MGNRIRTARGLEVSTQEGRGEPSAPQGSLPLFVPYLTPVLCPLGPRCSRTSTTKPRPVPREPSTPGWQARCGRPPAPPVSLLAGTGHCQPARGPSILRKGCCVSEGGASSSVSLRIFTCLSPNWQEEWNETRTPLHQARNRAASVSPRWRPGSWWDGSGCLLDLMRAIGVRPQVHNLYENLRVKVAQGNLQKRNLARSTWLRG